MTFECRGPSQKTRVLRTLLAMGSQGVTQVDFLAPNVCDQGAPVTRLAARIAELRGEGHEIVERGRRDACSVYVLVREQTEPLPVPVVPLTLEVGAGTPYDRWAA